MHIAYINPQGNFDRLDSYWTMHPDFGGQLVYVKEVANEMAKLGHKIDIITRRFDDDSFPEFKDEIDSYPKTKNLRIIRIPCGPNKFLAKELLWEHLDEWTNNILEFYKAEGSIFDFATGHYGDGGLVCAMLKAKTNIPYSFTGHSLGAQKFDKLNNDFLNFTELEKKYHFTKRVLAERTAIKYSDIIFVSTSQERDYQYSHKLYRQLLLNPPNFIVAPPGANTQVFAPFWSHKVDRNLKEKIDNVISRDIVEERINLPYIVVASRLDDKKNHVGLVEAYSNDFKLQERSNLLISLRGVENAFNDYSKLSDAEKIIIDKIMDIITKKSLKGKVMFVSINSQSELADTYRYMASKRSVFALTAFHEPFGLAPIEAMSTGLPVAVTKYGGPSEVLQEGNEKFGVLLDVLDVSDIGKGLNELFDNYDYYKNQGIKRVHSKYTWKATAQKYLEEISKITKKSNKVELPKYYESQDLKDLDLNLIKKIYKD